MMLENENSIVVGLDFTLCQCGQESDFGCHGVRDMEVYSEFFCKKCYHKKDKV
jgi:hypothetical protein